MHETLKHGLTPLYRTDYLYLSDGGIHSNVVINILCHSHECNKATHWDNSFFFVCYTHLFIRYDIVVGFFFMLCI